MALSSFAPTFSALCIVILVATCSVCLSLSIDQRKYIDRRTFGKMIGALSIPTTNIIALTHAPFLAHAASDDDESSPAATIEEIAAKTIARRLQDDILQQPPISSTPSERNGVDNTYYPDFLQGTWAVRQTLVNISTPLGLAYVGGPNGIESIAEKSMAESRQRLGKPVELQLRYLPTKFGVAEDRLFNTQQRLDAFAGRKVVSNINYADVGASNRAAVVAMGGTDQDPLQTVFVRFKGPAAQKTFVTSHGGHFLSPKSWVGFEGQRSIFALTNENTAPPIFTVCGVLCATECMLGRLPIGHLHY